MAMPQPPENTYVAYISPDLSFVCKRIGNQWVNQHDMYNNLQPFVWEELLEAAENNDANLYVMGGPPVTFHTVDRLKDGASYRAVYEGTWNSAYGTLDIQKVEDPINGGWLEDHDVALAKYMYEI